MMRLTKRALSAFLAFVMVFTMLPLESWASGADSGSANLAPYVEDRANNGNGSYTIKVGEEQTIRSANRGSWSISQEVEIVRFTNWSTSNRDDITVEGLNPGTATIEQSYFSYSDREWKTNTYTVIVVPEIERISLSDDSLTFTGKATRILTATVLPADAKDYTITWESSDDQVATVDEQGNVTSVGIGDAVITATVQGTDVKDICRVVVNDVTQVESIKLQPMSLSIGSTGKMAIVYTPGEPFDAQVTWQSSDPDVAKVDEDGTIHALQIGETKITATVGEKTATATATLTVTEKLPESITLNKEQLTLQGLTEEKLTATVLPADAVDKTVTWASSNPNAATVDREGNVTAVAPGQTTITATTVNGLEAVCEVTVERFGANESGTVPVYVYLQINNLSGIPASGWKENDSGWYTIGRLDIPSSEISRPWGDRDASDQEENVAISYLPYIDLSSINSAVAAGVTLQDCTWRLHSVSTGADDYVGSGDTWHLDGTYTIYPATNEVIVHYEDTYGNVLREPREMGSYNNGTAVKVDIPAIPNYTPKTFNGVAVTAGQTTGNVLVSGDAGTIHVYIVYQANAQTYTIRYLDEDTQEVIREPETLTAEYGQTIQASTIIRPPIENYKFDSISPNSLKVGNNNSLNVFTLYYVKNAFDVTYKYTLPVGLSFFNGEFQTEWEMVMTGASVATIPVLIIYLIFQKQIIKGIALTGIKG